MLVRTAPYFRMFKRDGSFVKAWGREPEISTPHSLTIDSQNNYWVSDSTGHQILKFDGDGKLLLTLGTKGKAGDNASRELFNQPNHVAVAPNGDIYVSDGYVNARVVHFTPDGEFVHVGGTMGKEPGQLQVPHGVALDSKGRIIVNDSDNARVSVFDEAGKFVESWPYPSRGGLVIAPDDTIYVSDVNAGVINVLKDGKLIASYNAPRAHGPRRGYGRLHLCIGGFAIDGDEDREDALEIEAQAAVDYSAIQRSPGVHCPAAIGASVRAQKRVPSCLADIGQVFEVHKHPRVLVDSALGHHPERGIGFRVISIPIIFDPLPSGVVKLESQAPRIFFLPHPDQTETVSRGQWNIGAATCRILLTRTDVGVRGGRGSGSLAPRS